MDALDTAIEKLAHRLTIRWNAKHSETEKLERFERYARPDVSLHRLNEGDNWTAWVSVDDQQARGEGPTRLAAVQAAQRAFDEENAAALKSAQDLLHQLG